MNDPLRMLYSSEFPPEFFGLLYLDFVYSVKYKGQDFCGEADFFHLHIYINCNIFFVTKRLYIKIFIGEYLSLGNNPQRIQYFPFIFGFTLHSLSHPWSTVV